MERRDFLRIVGAASLAPAVPAPAATVLYDDHAVALEHTGRDPKHATDALWVRKRDLPRINGFDVKPQGACRADMCIPITKTMLRGDYFDLTAFARKIGQAVVADGGMELHRLSRQEVAREVSEAGAAVLSDAGAEEKARLKPGPYVRRRKTSA